MLKDTLQNDLKQAMLARDTDRVEVIKGLKSAVLYEEVAQKKRDEGLSDQEILAVFKRESKKRQDSVTLYQKGGNEAQAEKELFEKSIIDKYLPEQLSEEVVQSMIDGAISELGLVELSKKDMGKIIGIVKSKAGAELDGSTLARLVGARIDG
jgi:uncharacterized protein YqeY